MEGHKRYIKSCRQCYWNSESVAISLVSENEPPLKKTWFCWISKYLNELNSVYKITPNMLARRRMDKYWVFVQWKSIHSGEKEWNMYVGHKRSLFLMRQSVIYVACGKARNNKTGLPTVNSIEHLQVVAVWWWRKGTKDHEHPWKRFTALFYFAKRGVHKGRCTQLVVMLVIHILEYIQKLYSFPLLLKEVN